jgi:hypothetical protein
LAKACPKCGKDTGFVYLQRWTRSNYKKKVDYSSGHKYKYADHDKPVEKKLLQEPDPIEVILSRGHLDCVHSYLKIWNAFKDIVISMFEKYFQLFNAGENQEMDIRSIIRGIDVQHKVFTPFSSQMLPDNRSLYGLDFSQWLSISLYASRHSYRETARKYGVSVNSMKRQLKVVKSLSEEFVTHILNLKYFIYKMKKLRIMSTDRELRSNFESKCKTIIEEFKNDQLSRIRRAELEAEYNNNGGKVQQNQEQGHQYRYYQIIHGKKEKRCGPFKEADLPPELLIQYRKKHENKKADNANSQKYKNDMIKIQTFRSEYSEDIKILDNLFNYFLS